MRQSPPLDSNSRYLYLLLCTHFADTCVVAERDGQIVGFVSGYLPPGNTAATADPTSLYDDPVNTDHADKLSPRLFIWQVAVHPDVRGKGLATRMLVSLLQRDICRPVRYLEATISPSNQPSQRLFEGLAQSLGAPCERSCLFPAELFGDQTHEQENLYRIGPIHAQTWDDTMQHTKDTILS